MAEREQRTLRRLLISPMPGTSYFTGLCLAQGVIAIGQTVIVLVVSKGMGAAMAGSWGLLMGLLSLCLISYVGAGLVLGTHLAERADDINAVVATFGIPILILGGAFFPSSIFPPTLAAIAIYNPVYHMTEAVTGVWADGLGWEDIAFHGQVLIGFSSAMIGAGAFSYRQLLVRERRR